ncbi:MAG: 4-hydroxy-tetrahydrodipicolinate reductase [Rhodospirillaceae bacterium]|nr:4-hydroxy-tetrahydrodipicolinate reductase [Rhodospirillaceae bacterium]MBT4486541.1 4-hydroxy-tetrahydrodipicolinate reductase [Rhodospirillaceae bacterium]MBT5194900.1 4-hydroxy-tetrahydrodipicolinate reductase [Rhodospirillaceae bacterium]MBT5896836.1 4-hydroxy-tetrahydrodipicolinate reductase [Rhodospirillaceae bacterium]MBT6429167.1 4-hydroxy-tetrahydrodipicolinate reductase [Rhodospirillaceae bacterium]
MQIGVVGCAGRMGINLLRQIDAADGCVISGGSERPGHDAVGRDLGELAGLSHLGIAVEAEPRAVFDRADVVLDFTVPAATVAHAAMAVETGTRLVIGTTGMTAEDDAAIKKAAEAVAIMREGNMSLGVNVLAVLTERLASYLDEDFDIEIVEMHHRYKVDAPSGTALLLGRAAATGRQVDHEAVLQGGRHGITGERRRGDIGYSALRGGNVAGEHTVIFAADDERVELSHKATDRAIFARGAMRAARWLADKDAGLYGMADVLGL